MELPHFRIETVLGDITQQDTDAIVNAANEQLQAGGGVCGAIFAAAGASELQAACNRLGGCPTGQARLTAGFRIPVKGIIHAVGPIYRGGGALEVEQLASAWRSSLDIADAHGYHSIAFPSISTGIYGYPLLGASAVVATTFVTYAEYRDRSSGSLTHIRIVVRDPETKAIYDQAIASAFNG